MTSAQKVRTVYPSARLARHFGGCQIFADETVNHQLAYIGHRNSAWAWAEAWRNIQRTATAGKEEKNG